MSEKKYTDKEIEDSRRNLNVTTNKAVGCFLYGIALMIALYIGHLVARGF